MRLLVVAYYFPPSGGPGVQRVLKLVKYLGGFGVEPAVLTVDDGAFPHTDAALGADVPAATEVRRAPSLDPLRLYATLKGQPAGTAVPVGSLGDAGSWGEQAARFIRANVFLPDARIGWVPYAARAARRWVDEAQAEGRPFGAVLTSGPPHSCHLVGLALKRARPELRWVADFRDPWTGINYYDELPMTAAARAVDRRLEGAVLRHADAVTTVSPTWAEAIARKGARAVGAARPGSGTVHVVHNGFDPDDFAGAAPPVPSDRFVLAHVGSLYASRDAPAVWEAMARLVSRGMDRLRLRLVGPVDASVRASIARHGLEPYVEHRPYVPHPEAVAEMRAATALLLTIEPFALGAGMITGKAYEYLASGRPVVGVGTAGGDAARLLASTGAGALFGRADARGIERHLGGLYEAWQRTGTVRGAALTAVAPFSRRLQAERVASIVEGSA